ncbi:MAG: hypothetical protein E7Z64_06195 [Thermoplasmata archaeon]|nr:hypothetical protein [Thermoplasmata archaeon]
MTESYECLPSIHQDLTFRNVRPFLDDRLGRRFTLKDLLTESGEYNNYAYLLSDQCPWHIVMDHDGRRMTYSGPLPVQLSRCLSDLQECNPSISLGSKPGRYRRYPTLAVREVMSNSLIHFDASLEADISVSMSDNVLSVTSPGGVRSCSDTATGPRNGRMSNLLRHLNLASRPGCGMDIIRSSYSRSGLSPAIIKTEHRFTVRLPSLDSKGASSSDMKETVSEFLRSRPGSMLADLAGGTMLSVHELNKILTLMEADGELFTLGLGSKRMIFLTRPSERRSEEVGA